jgi:hypothetical protein
MVFSAQTPRTKSMGRIAGTCLLCGILVLVQNQGLAQNDALEYQVKAVFLLNFARFVEWPQQALAADNFIICLLGDPFQGVLETAIRNETLNGRPLAIRTLTAMDSAGQCQILFISASEAARTAEALRAVAAMPVLTVGESGNFIIEGGMIRFTQGGRRIRFEINPDAARLASLKISSRLLRLADIVRGSQGGGRQ